MRTTRALRFLLRWRTWLLSSVFILIAGVFDLRVIKWQTLWADEIFSLAIATGHSVEHPAKDAVPSLGDFVQADQPIRFSVYRAYIDHSYPRASFKTVIRAVFVSDTNPPLYYLLLHCWTRLVGTSDRGLRSFSIGWYLCCIPLLLLVARQIGGGRAELATGLVFIASPISVYYSTEGRMYSQVWFFVLLTAWLTLVLRKPKRNVIYEALWILSSVGGLLTHYFFVFPLCASLAFLYFRPGEDRLPRLICRTGVVTLLVAPWYSQVPASLRNWRVTQDWLNLEPDNFSRAKATIGMILQFFSNDGHYLWWDHPVAKVILLSVFSILFVVMLFKLKKNIVSGPKLLPWLWFCAACAGPVLFDLLRHTYTINTPRYAISGLPAASLLTGIALACLARPVRIAVLVIIVGAWSYSLKSIVDNPARDDEPLVKVGEVLSADATAADLVIVQSVPTGVIGVARYSQSPARMIDWVSQLGKRTVSDSMEPMISGARHIFFVRYHDLVPSAPEEDWLRLHANVVREARFGLIRLVEFSPATGDHF